MTILKTEDLNSKIDIDLYKSMSNKIDFDDNPFMFNPQLKIKSLITPEEIKKIIFFNNVDNGYNWLQNSILNNYQEYGISEDIYKSLSNKYKLNVSYFSEEDTGIESDYSNDSNVSKFEIFEEKEQSHYQDLEEDLNDKEDLNYKDDLNDKEDEDIIEEDPYEETDEFKNHSSINHSSMNQFSHIPTSTVSNVNYITNEKKMKEEKKYKRNKFEEIKKILLDKNFISDIYKKEDILKYLKEIKPTIEDDILDDITPSEIEDLHKIIQDIRMKNKIDFSYLIIKVIVYIFETIMINVFNILSFKGLCKGLTMNIVKGDLYSTHSYISDKINCPNIPFIDVFYYIIKQSIAPILL